MKKGKRNGFWAAWYENGTRMSGRKYFEEKDILQEDQIPSELINFWNAEGKHTVINGNGDYFYRNQEGEEHKGSIKNYKKEGVWIGSRQNGSLIYKEDYVDGELEKGESWDKEEKKYTYNVVFENVKYLGGQEALFNVIRKHFKVPKYAIENGIEGVILIVFQINKTGKIQNIEVRRKVCDPCAEAALKVVKKLKKWKPAKRRGQLVTVEFSLPLRIQLMSK